MTVGGSVVVDGEDDAGGEDVVLEPPAGGTVATVDEGATVVDGATVVVVGATVVEVVGASVVVVVVVGVGIGLHFHPFHVHTSSKPGAQEVACAADGGKPAAHTTNKRTIRRFMTAPRGCHTRRGTGLRHVANGGPAAT